MANTDGVEIKITSDSSQAVREFSKIKQALEKLKSIDIAQEKRMSEIAASFNIPTITKIVPHIEEARTLGRQLLDDIKKSSDALNTVGKKFETAFGSMFKTISVGVTAVAGVISIVTKNALSIGGGFEAQMTSVKVISSATAEELDALTKKAREMGATLPITAKDAAQAMELLAQRGTQAKDILVTVADVSALAISQNVDMASAADLLGSTMTNFGIALQDASKVTDIFNNACNQSALSMQKIINAMKYVGPAANAVGMELTEAVSALEVLTNAGLSGEMAGAGLNVVLSKLASEAHIFGVEVNNLDGSMRDIADIFSELQKNGFSLAEATSLFGNRGAKAALALAKYSNTLKQNQANLQKWGATQSAVTEKMKTWINIWNSFQSASEELHIEIFEQIKNQAKEAVGSVADLTRQFSKWVGETQIAGQALNSFLEGLGFNIPSIGDFQSLLNSFNVQSFLDSVKSFGSSLKGIVDSIAADFSMIKIPLLWLIEHLGLLMSLSFWGWIIGKGLQVPAAILGIASAFKKFYSTVIALQAVKWVALTENIRNFNIALSSPVALTSLFSISKWTAIINPITATIAALTVLGAKLGRVKAEAKNAEKEFNNTIKRIQNEIRDADNEVTLYVNENIKTGFEGRPDAYVKASDEVRSSFDDIVASAQKAFREQFSEALDFVIDKFPDLVEETKKAGININKIGDSTLASISKALSGDEETYKVLPDIFKKVTERINQMNLALGKGNSSLVYMIAKFDNLNRDMEKMKPQNKVNTFLEEISANLRNVLANLPKQFEEANKFLKGSNNKLAIDVSLTQAKDALNAFIKEVADKFAIPEDIVKESTLNRLKELAAQGDRTARILLQSWGDVDNSFDDFLDKANDAINYLGEAPQKFLPALNSMLNGIQKFDPLTGKLTDKFKKAHNALKDWANVTFDKLENRIQKLRKAVEGGFIDKSVLEKELKDVLPQLKLKVVSELEPMKGQFNSQSAYQATLASDLVAMVQDWFGDVGTELLRNIYNGKSGSDIGRDILRDTQRNTSGSNNGVIYINGIEQSLGKAVSPLTDEIKIAATHLANFSLGGMDTAIRLLNEGLNNNSAALNNAGNSMLSFINSIKTPEANRNTALYNYSADFNNIINSLSTLNSAAQGNINAVASVENAILNLQSALANISALHQANSNALAEVIRAVQQIDTSIKSLNNGNTYNIDVQQQGFNVEKKSDADYLARSTASAIRSGLGNGGM